MEKNMTHVSSVDLASLLSSAQFPNRGETVHHRHLQSKKRKIRHAHGRESTSALTSISIRTTWMPL